MGTRFNLLLPGIDKIKGDELFTLCTNEINRLEVMLSCFLTNSDISFINRNAFRQTVEVNPELFEILDNCLTYLVLTQGAFDIGLGKLIEYWNKKTAKDNLNDLIQQSGSKNIILDKKNKSIHFISPFVKINLGGFGKGYALQKVQDMLKKERITSAYISFGESSVSCIGKHPHGDYWPVGIQDFFQKDKSIATIKLINQSVSTSGNMEGNYHIINPQTGHPVKDKKMITVKSLSVIDAEVLSTAFMILEAGLWNKVKSTFPEIEIFRQPLYFS